MILIITINFTYHYHYYYYVFIFACNTCLFLKQKRKNPKETHTCTKEVEDPLKCLSHFHYGNNTEPASEPVDPASEQNHMGPPDKLLTSLDSSWECWALDRDTTRVDSSRSVAPDEVRHSGAGHGPAGGGQGSPEAPDRIEKHSRNRPWIWSTHKREIKQKTLP